MTGTEIARRDTMASKVQYAKALAPSRLLPEQYRNQPENVLWAVEYGDMLGLSSMAAITGVHVIEGKPTASAGLISALVRRAGHKLRITGDGESATCKITRRDDPEFTFEVTWTLAMAVQAGLCELRNGKPYARSAKGKPLNWETYPASMLKSRAITQCARDACEEVLFGLHYTPEELGAEVDEEGRVVGGAVEGHPQPQPADNPGSEVVDAEVVIGTEWVDEALVRAVSFTTDDEGRELWRETAAKRAAGEITAEDDAKIAGLIKARWAELGKQLDPDDPWAAKVEEISDPDAASAAIAEVQLKAEAGEIEEERANRIRAAILAKAEAVAA